MSTCRFILSATLAAAFAAQATASQAQLATCAGIADDRERLGCYDALARRQEPVQLLAPTAPSVAPPVSPPVASSGSADMPQPAQASDLETRWELRPDLQHGIFNLSPYQPLYALAHGTNSTNSSPSSPTHPATAPSDIRLDHVEAKLQLSLKTKLIEDILGGSADLWFGYTQQSYWQVANSRYSSPFRETNYQPEAILVQPLAFALGGVHARFVGLSLTHQSNGRGESLSRSWNRVIGNLALEAGPWSLQIRPWARIDTASGAHDDNPDIEDFMGRGELVAVYRNAGQVLTFTGRHTLRGGDRSRGAAEIDWAFPLTGSLKGHLQVFTGYGESLIDYNHRQTTVGVGVSFFD